MHILAIELSEETEGEKRNADDADQSPRMKTGSELKSV